MKIMTWNIQDGGALSKKYPKVENINSIIKTIKDENPDVLVIQEYETQYHKQLVIDGLEKLNYKWTFCNDDEERTLRNRVLIASKKEFVKLEIATNIYNYSRRNWNEVIIKGNRLKVLGVHVPLAETSTIYGKKIDSKPEKETYLKALLLKFKEYKDYSFPAVILGDFNLHNDAACSEYLKDFSDLLEEVTSNEPTWKNKKVDYVFVNNEFKISMKEKDEKIAPRENLYSDHKYFCIELEDNELKIRNV